ncbi:MAG: HEAT repeat domain-containing protein [Planctomycetes bacterium]|nr:HEAT repeat domain-containing protein [Planctomycetota bacterium]
MIKTVITFLFLVVSLSLPGALSADPIAEEGGPATDESFIRAEIARLAHAQGAVQVQAHDNLVRIGRGAVALLKAALADPDATLRAAASGILGEIADPSATQALAPLLDDPHPSVRRNAARALARIGDEGSLDVLRGGLTRTDPIVVAEALSGFVSHPEALDSGEASARLRHEDVKVRRGAVELLAEQALRKVGSPEGEREALSNATQDADGWVVLNARIALAALGDTVGLDGVCAGVTAPEDWIRARARAVIASIDADAALRTYRAALASPEAHSHVIQEEAATALGALGRREGVGSLLPRLASPYADVRAAAGRSLCCLTGTSHGFQPDGGVEERARSVARWRAWWEENRYFYEGEDEAVPE